MEHIPIEASRKITKISRQSIKRSRTPNWSPHERQYLIELIRQRKDIITKLNGPSDQRENAWREIMQQLIVKYGNKFSASSTKKLKTQWQNMKRLARDELILCGTRIEDCSSHTMEICDILNMFKDGSFRAIPSGSKVDQPSFTNANVEIKTERIDEENVDTGDIGNSSGQPMVNGRSATEQSVTSISDDVYSDGESDHEFPSGTNGPINSLFNLPSSGLLQSAEMTPSPQTFQEFLSFTNAQRQLKMETLKEEHQVMKTVRETVELKKIIAEQKLQHLLWLKRKEVQMYAGEPGSGAGKGGGGGGAIREAGGAFGKMEAAREDEYFYRKQKEQIEQMKGHLDKEIAFHQDQIKRHEDAIRRHKERINTMDDN